MKNYLSIGEAAHLKRISTKALRYYDEIGILKPAFISPETKYRYYTMEQMVDLELIIICNRLNIPLKSFNRYKSESGHLHIDQMIVDGRKIAEEQAKKIKYMIYKLDNIAKHIDIYQEIKDRNGDYLHEFKERQVLVTPWNGDLGNDRLFIDKTEVLIARAKELKRATLFQWGIMYHYTEEGVKNYVYTELEPRDRIPDDVMVIPKGEYKCLLISNDNLSEIKNNYANNSAFPIGTIILGAEMIGSCIDNLPAPYEIQYLNNKL